MALSNGPNLGILVDGAIGEVHYDALMQQWRAMDALVQPRVKSATITTPPVSPSDGDCYIVPSGATGVWSGNTNKIARYSSKQTVWEYYTPKNGWVVHNEATSSFIKFNGTTWVDPISNKADLVDGKVPASQLPSYVDDVLEYANFAAFPATGETGKIYVAIDTGNSYRWSGSVYTKISQPLDEIPQAEAEAGTASTLRAATARRIKQAFDYFWSLITTIDGKAIGPTTRASGRFTVLEANSYFNLGGTGMVNSIGGVTSFTANSVGGGAVLVSRQAAATAGHQTFGMGTTMRISTEANVTGYEIGGNFVLYPAVKVGFTQGGYTKGAEMSVLRNIVSLGYDDNGTLSTMQGLSIAVGHYNTSGSATPVTTTCSGISLTPYCLTGSITNLSGLSIGAISGASSVAVASALKLGFAATVEAHRNIDASGTAYNYLNGNTGIGVQPSSSAKLDVAGPLRHGQYTLSTLPSAAAFSGCLIDVTNATGGPKTCRSDGTSWKILNTLTTVS